VDAPLAPSALSLGAPPTGAPGFSSVLGNLVSAVDAKQDHAQQVTRSVLLGQGAQLHESVIAMQEAGVSFQLMVEVRNKLVESYQELMRMPVYPCLESFSLMQSFLGSLVALWRQLGLNQRVSLIVAAFAVVGSLGALVIWSRQPDYQLLYGRLSDKDAAQIICSLQTQGVPHRTGQGGAMVYVPADQVHRLRPTARSVDRFHGHGEFPGFQRRASEEPRDRIEAHSLRKGSHEFVARHDARGRDPVVQPHTPRQAVASGARDGWNTRSVGEGDLPQLSLRDLDGVDLWSLESADRGELEEIVSCGQAAERSPAFTRERSVR
jgi:flagellar hook-basal body complex protein FliE